MIVTGPIMVGCRTDGTRLAMAVAEGTTAAVVEDTTVAVVMAEGGTDHVTMGFIDTSRGGTT